MINLGCLKVAKVFRGAVISVRARDLKKGER